MKRFMQKVVLLMCCFAFICIAACGNVESKGDGGDTTHEEEQGNSNEDDMAKEMYIKIGQTVLTAVLEDNSSVEALIDLLPISLTMRDYGGFEKVGEIGATLPQNNERITTSFGDLILYQGNQFSIYYDTNTWALTRLGKIVGVTQAELKNILGEGEVKVTISLTK